MEVYESVELSLSCYWWDQGKCIYCPADWQSQSDVALGRFLVMNEVATYKEELEKEINELLNLQVVGELKPKEERRLNLLHKEYERIAGSQLRKETSS